MTQPSPDASRFRFRLFAPFCCLVLFVLAACVWLFDRATYVQVLDLWGASAAGWPFADLKNLTSAIECSKSGIDVYRVNPCDPLGRVFPYSRLWLDVGTRLPSFLNSRTAGVCLDLGFIGSLGFAGRPRTWREAGTYLLACTSTASAYALERANVDLSIFILLISAVVLAAGSPRRRALGYAAIVLAGLLKYYPIAALIIVLRESPRRFMAVVFVALVALAILFVAMRHDLAIAMADIPHGRYGVDAFGAANVVYLTLGPRPPAVAAGFELAALGLCSVVLAIAFARDTGLARAMDRLDVADRLLLLVGVAVVVGCFIAGQNIVYRAIFFIPAIGGLIPLKRVADRPRTAVRLAWLIAVVLSLMWSWVAFALIFQRGPGIPVALLLVRELVWWWVVAMFSAILLTWTFQSNVFVSMRRALNVLLPDKAVGLRN